MRPERLAVDLIVLLGAAVTVVLCACVLAWSIGLLGPLVLLILWPLIVVGVLALGAFLSVFGGRG